MFGKGMEDMIASMLGINPEELKAQINKAMSDAGAVIGDVQQKQLATLQGVQLVFHKITRIEKMMENMCAKIGAEIPVDPASEEKENGPGNNVVAIGSNTRQ